MKMNSMLMLALPVGLLMFAASLLQFLSGKPTGWTVVLFLGGAALSYVGLSFFTKEGEL